MIASPHGRISILLLIASSGILGLPKSSSAQPAPNQPAPIQQGPTRQGVERESQSSSQNASASVVGTPPPREGNTAALSPQREPITAEPEDAFTPENAPPFSEPIFPKLRRIFFFPSNAPRLVPPNFWAVGIDELEAALAQQAEVLEPGSEVPQLVSALYVARFSDGSLISDNESSVLDIAYRDDAPSSLLLGDLNLALTPQAANPAQSLTAKLVTMSNGQVKAVVYRDCRLRFGWSRRGQLGADDRYQFDLRIPPCGRTRLLLGVPDGFQLTSRDGVVTQLPSPPQEVGNLTSQTPTRWYSIEAGGLSKLRLTIAPTNPPTDNTQVIVVRDLAVDCRVLPSGMDWRGTIACDIPAGLGLPTIAVLGGGRVNSVTVDNQPVTWRESTGGVGEIVLQLNPPTTPIAKTTTSRIQITGLGPLANAPQDQGLSRLALPWLQIVGSPRVIAGSSHQLDLSVSRPMRVAFLEQTVGWSIVENVTIDENQESLIRFTGPADAAPPIVSLSDSLPSPEINSLLKINSQDNTLRSTWIADISVKGAALTPLRFRIQEGWRLNTAFVRGSERAIDLQSDVIRNQLLTIWPDVTDLVDGVLRLEVSGEWERAGSQPLETLPPTWFMQAEESFGRAFALVLPPSEMEWDVTTTFQGRRLSESQLPTEITNLAGILPEDALFFEIGRGGSPDLKLTRPTAAFNSETHFDLRLDGQYVIEKVRIDFRVPAGRLSSVSIGLGDSIGRPPMQWSILPPSRSATAAGNTPTETGSLKATLSESMGEVEQIWELLPATGIYDGLVIQGERRYDQSLLLEERIVQFPNILVSSSLPATSHRGTCTLGPGLLLLGGTSNTLKLPTTAPEISPAPSGNSREKSSHVIGPTVQSANQAADWTIRFPGNALANMRLKLQSLPANPAVIWQEKMDLMAGTSLDEIACRYTVDAAAPISIRFPRALDLTKIVGGEILRSREDSTAKTIDVRPAEKEAEFVVYWRRGINQHQLFRYCDIPNIETDAMVFSREIDVWAASNVQLLHPVDFDTPPRWLAGEASGYRFRAGQTNRIRIITKNSLLAIGGAIAVVFTVLAWCVSRYANRLSLPILGLLLTLTWLNPAWQAMAIAFAAFPWAIGLLLSTSLNQLSSTAEDASITHERSRRGHQSKSAKTQKLGFPSLCVAMFVSINWSMPANAQSPLPVASEDGQPSSPPISVLIPVTQDGQVAGDKVYIPEAFREMLFSVGKEKAKELGNDFRSADYQVRINPTGMTDLGELVSVEATWRVEVDTTEQAVFLPISGNSLERLEVILDGTPNEIRANVVGDGVSFRPPRTGGLVIRAQLTPPVVTTVAGANRISLPIPPTAVAGLSIVSESPFEQISLPNCRGKITRFETGNRLSAELGGVDQLEIIWQRRGVGLTGNLKKFTRLWLVQVDEHQLSRELELAVGEGVRAGVVVDLVIDTPQTPLLTSNDWTLARNGGTESISSRYRLVAATDNPGPIRLLWTAPVNAQSSRTIQLPDVRSNSQVEGIDTLVAFHLDGDWRVNLEPIVDSNENSGINPVEAIDVEAFQDLWDGYPIRMDAVRRLLFLGPAEFQLVREETLNWDATEIHEVILAPRSLQIEYELKITPGTKAQPPVGLRLPDDLRVERFIWNDRELNPEFGGDWNATRLLLPELPKDRPTSCRLTGTMELKARQDFQLPRIIMEGIESKASQYIVRRTEGIRLSEIAPPSGVAAAPVTPEYDLTNGTIPLRAWNFPQSGGTPKSTTVDGTFQIVPAFEEFASRSLTTLRWEEGTWRMETTIDIESLRDSADFLTFEIPTRWTQGLDVQPAAKWSIQPTLDRSQQLLRILPETISADRLTGIPGGPEEGKTQRITIRSSLENPGDGGIEVPDLRMLGMGESQRFFAAPKRLTNSQITWQTQNARPTELPFEFRSVAPSTDTHSTFEVLGESFMATLTPATNAEALATIPTCQLSVFLHEGKPNYTMVQRWHVNPGTVDQIDFEIPASYRILGLWASGIPIAVPQSVDSTVRVPLPLSLLCQEIVLFMEAPLALPDTELPLVVPTDISVEQTWVAFYAKQDKPSPAQTNVGRLLRWLPPGLSQRVPATHSSTLLNEGWIEIAPDAYRSDYVQALMSTLELSVDNVAERSAQEKWEWLEPWLHQLKTLGWVPTNQVSSNQGQPPADVSLPESSTESLEEALNAPSKNLDLPANTTSTSLVIPDDLSDQVNGWLPKFLQQIFGADAGDMSKSMLRKRTSPKLLVPGDWTPTSVFYANNNPKTIWIPIIANDSWQESSILRYAMAGLVVVGGLVVFTLTSISLGRHRLSRPPFWMTITGALLLFLVPLPVALAVIVLSILTPLLGSQLAKMRDSKNSSLSLRSETGQVAEGR